MALQDKITQFSTDVDIAHNVVHGGPTVSVNTEGGPVRSLAKLIADGQAAINAAIAAFPTPGNGGGAANWGAIGGSLANQADLVAALGSKQNALPAGNFAQYLRGDKVMANLDKAAVGLSNVDNTADSAKPVSTAQAAAIGLKANLASPALTGIPTAPTAAPGTATDQIATMKAVAAAVQGLGGGGAAVWGGIGGTLSSQTDLVQALAGKQDALPVGTSIQYRRGDNTVANLDKTAVGLNNVDNTSDANKPVSTATATALGLKADKSSLNAAGVGLGNVNNTADADKPVSTAQAAAINARAPLASPALTGTPTAPTAALGTDTDQIATMKAVKAAVAAGGGGGGTANPMTTAGDMIVGGASGAATRLGKGANNYVLTMDATTGLPSWKLPTGGSASNANNVFLDSLAGPARSVQQKLRETISVYDFGAVGTDRNGNNPLSNRYATLADARAVYPFATSLADQIDWAATQLLGNFSRDQGRPVTLAGARLNINRAVILTGYYDIDGEGAAIGGQFQTAGRIFGNSTAPDLTYPDATNPRVLNGCVFYIVNTPYYSKLKNMSFFDLRFAVCFYGTPNTPFFINTEFNYTQCAVLYYNGCQNPRYIGCGGIELGVLHASSVTCYPADHPQGGDDFYFSDNLKFVNEGTFNSFGAGSYPDFDTWFIASILRPNVPSRAYQQPDQTYNDRNGQVYTDPYFLNPTGRLIFCPFRNGRDAFGVYMNGLDIRGRFKYGYALINTQVRDLLVEQCQYEQLVEAMEPGRPIIGTFGAVVAGTLSHMNQLDYIDGDHPLLGYSGRGKSDGYETDLGIFRINPTEVKRFGQMNHRGYMRGKFYMADRVIPFADNTLEPQTNGSDQAPARAYLDMRGTYLEDHYLKTMVENIPQQFFLPTRTSDGKSRTELSLFGTPFVGNMEVTVWNMTRGGAPDYANYHVDTASTQVLTLKSAFTLGMTEAEFNENIDSGYDSPRFAYYQVENQAYGFGADGAGGNRVRVMGDGNRLRGAFPAGGLPAGTRIIRSQALIPLTEFKRGWAAVTSTASIDGFDGLIDGQGNGTIGIKNLTGNWQNPDACDMLTVQVRLSQFRNQPGDVFMAAAPTTGRWRTQATVKRRLDGTSPVLEWTCVAGGQPGTWRATKWETRSGNTASRPTGLGATDIGVAYLDTQLSKIIFWSGSTWLV